MPARGLQSVTTEILSCGSLRFTQNSCSDTFSCGRPLAATIQEIVDQSINTLQDPNFVLDVVRLGDKDYSIDNRRLCCLKAAALISGRNIYVEANVYNLSEITQHIQHGRAIHPITQQALERFAAHYDTECDGEDIIVRWR